MCLLRKLSKKKPVGGPSWDRISMVSRKLQKKAFTSHISEGIKRLTFLLVVQQIGEKQESFHTFIVLTEYKSAK